MTKKVTFDIDDVLANWLGDFFRFTNEKYGTDFIKSDADHWAFNERSPKILEKAAKRGLDSSWFPETYIQYLSAHSLASVPLLPGVKNMIHYLDNHGWELSVATDRVVSLDKEDVINAKIEGHIMDEDKRKRLKNLIMEDTLAWFSINFGQEYFPQSKIRFSNGETKAKICQDLGSKVLVEDSYRNSVQHASIPGNFALLVDSNHNQGPEVPNVIRMKVPSYLAEYDKYIQKYSLVITNLEMLAKERFI